MELFRYHVFVCDQRKPGGLPCCSERGSAEVIEALRREIAAQGLIDEVQLTVCGSLGLCERGPNMVVYPDGIWYSAISPGDVPEIVRSHFRDGIVVERLANLDGSSLRAEILGNREKMRAAMRAREASGALPDDLLALTRAFQESRAVLTAIELDLFTAVGNGATAQAVAAAIRADPRATETLLNALVALDLLSKSGGVFVNRPVAARFLDAASPACARLALMHTVHLWDTWSSLTGCVRAGTAVQRREATVRDPAWTEAFIAAMHRNASERAPAVVEAVGLEGVRRLIDVGGGSGAYSIAFARASRTLQAEVFDLPEVLPIARRHIEDAGLSARIATRAGDLRTDSFGAGYDLVFLSAICHMLSPEENLNLFVRSLDALAPGGRIVVQDFLLDASKTSPRHAALFALNMLVGTRGGSSYSEDEYASWLREAGFADVRRIFLPGPTGLMTGVRL